MKSKILGLRIVETSGGHWIEMTKSCDFISFMKFYMSNFDTVNFGCVQ